MSQTEAAKRFCRSNIIGQRYIQEAINIFFMLEVRYSLTAAMLQGSGLHYIPHLPHPIIQSSCDEAELIRRRSQQRGGGKIYS